MPFLPDTRHRRDRRGEFGKACEARRVRRSAPRTVALRRLVTGRKSRFTWLSPTENPYILRDETRSTIESRYADVAFAMSNSCMESRMC